MDISTEKPLYLNIISCPYLKNVLKTKERLGMLTGVMHSKYCPRIPTVCLQTRYYCAKLCMGKIQ